MKFLKKLTDKIHIRWRTKLQKLTEGRPEKSIQDLIDEAVNKGYDSIIAEKLFAYLIEHIHTSGIEKFTIDFQDDVYNHYELNADEFSIDVIDLLKGLKIKLTKEYDEKFFETEQKKYTVEYVIAWMDWCRLKSLERGRT